MTTAQVDTPASPGMVKPVDQTARLRRIRDRAGAWLGAGFAALDRLLARRMVWLVAVVLVMALQIVLTLDHRPWLDEWQALQLSVQSPHLSDLMFNVRYEGHPPLWYLILRGLAGWFADPATALPVAALLIAIPVQLTVLLAAPFSRAERLMIALSQFVLIEYLTISRSMTLGFALMLAIGALWKRTRVVWLLLAVLPQCDFLFGVISLLFLALLWRERRVDWPFAVVWLISGLFAAWSIRPMPDLVPSLVPMGFVHDITLWMANFSTLGLPLQWNEGQPVWNWPPPPGLGGPALVGFLAVAWVELRRRPAYLTVFAVFVATTLVFSMSVYQLSIRHLMLAAALLIVLVWRLADQGVARSVWWRTWLMIAAVCGLMTAGINLARPFDTAPEAAALINRLGLHDRTWVPFPHSAGQSVAAINAMQFERLAEHCSEDLVRWNAFDDHRIRDIASLKQRLARKVAQDGRFYLLTWLPIPDQAPLMRRVGTVAHGYDGQDFYLYIVGEGHADARPHGRPCITPLAPLRQR